MFQVTISIVSPTATVFSAPASARTVSTAAGLYSVIVRKRMPSAAAQSTASRAQKMPLIAFRISVPLLLRFI